MPATLISADIFHAGIFNGPAAPAYVKSYDAEGDRDGLFLVLQPLILTGSGPLGSLPEARWRYAHLKDYFASPPPLLGDANHPAVLASEALTRKGWPSASEWRDAAVPVPFPPQTQFDLELAITYDRDANPTRWTYNAAIPDFATAVRPLTGDPGLAAPAADWPQLAVQSFIRPRIDDYAELSPDQQAEVRDWLIGAIAHLRSPPVGTTPTPAQTAIVNQFIVNDPVFGPSAVSQSDDARVLQWRERLERQPSLARALYSAFLHPDPDSPPGTTTYQHFDAPAYHYGPSKLPPITKLFPDDGGQPVILGSYHHLLWKTFAESLQNGAAAMEQQVAKSLARLYGLGERLRWPDASHAQSPDRFMVVDSQSDRLANAIGTNAQSLAGQVFRIGDLRRRITQVQIVRFQVNGFDLVWKPDQQAVPDGPQDPVKAQVAQSFVDFSTHVQSHAGQTFAVSLKNDPANPDGLVQFQPRLAKLLEEPLGQGLELPRSLLDYAERVGRSEMPWGSDRLVIEDPQRTGLTKDEVLGGDQFISGVRTLNGAFRLRVRLVRRPRLGAGRAQTGGSSASYVYDVAIAEPLAAAEKKLVETAFTVPGARVLELWIAQEAGAPSVVLPLSGPLVYLPGGGPYPLPIIRVVDGATIDLIDDALKRLPQALRSDRGFALNLAIRNLELGDPFNVVPASAIPQERTLVGLTTRYENIVGHSADLLAARLEGTFDPTPADPADPVLNHYRNFSKLRLATQFGAKWTLLTYPDALAPLRTPSDGPADPGGLPPDPVADPLNAGRPPRAGSPTWSYAIVHRFDRELDDGSEDQGATARTAEEARYGFVTSPGGTGQFGGYVEHQYSVRLALAGAPSVEFPIEHSVRHAAELTSELHKPASRATGAERRQTIALLGFTCDLHARTISLSFDPRYFQQLFADAWANGGQRKPLDAYRAIYESLAELRTSLAAGKLEIRLEGWRFDNRQGDVIDAEAPDFLRSFRPAGRCSVRADAISNLATDLTALIDAVLGPTYVQFCANVDAVIAGTSTLPALRPVDLTDAAWTWTKASGGPYSAAELATDSVVSRAGIRIARPASIVIPPSASDGRFIALQLSDDLRSIALWSPPAGSTGYEFLAPAAKAELSTRLQEGSDLFERSAWMVCRDRIDPSSPKPFEATLQVHFGEVANLLSVPARRAQDIPVVSDLYYVPFGFLPIAKHPDLADQSVTFEFACWLVRLVQSILDGSPFTALELDGLVSAQDAETQRQMVQDLVELDGGIAAQICNLVLRVDDPASIDPAKSDAVYDKVNRLLETIDGSAQDGLRKALRSRFMTKPSEFADLRGLGIVLLDPDRESSALYSLRINKRVREDLTEPMRRGAPRDDVDEFHYTHVVEHKGVRFLVDALDDVTYDAEFTIEQNRYMQAGAIIPDHHEGGLGRLGEMRTLDANTQLVLRGDAQARTGEDVIEADLDPTNELRIYQPDGAITKWAQDPPPVATAQRQLEVNVVHFNPSWRVRKAGFVQAWQYLLPSRIPPSKPTVLLPKDTSGTGRDPRVSTVRVGPNEDPMQSGLFAPRLAAELAARNSVSVSVSGGTDGAKGLTLTAVPDYTVVEKDPSKTQGWQRYDAVLAHHYFLVDADPDATPADITQDDAILIDTSADEEDPSTAPSLPPAINGLQSSLLYQWFWYDRMRRTPGAKVDKPAARPTLAGAVEQIYRAFDIDRVTHVAGGHSILRPAAPSAAAGSAATYRPSPAGGSLESSRSTSEDAIGGVVAAEIMTVSGDDPNTVTRYAVRVTTLETPLRRTRVRVRVLRNYRDVDADMQNDIAQAFQMTSAFSEWSERSDRAIRLGPDDFIQMQANRGWILNTKVNLADWLAIDIDQPASAPGLTRDFGPVLQEVIRATTAANPQCRLWGTEAEDERWQLYGLAHDMPRDAHIILGNSAPERAERVQRQNLVAASGKGPVTWSRVNELTSALDRKQIVSARFEITFFWCDGHGRRIMELTFPMRFAR